MREPQGVRDARGVLARAVLASRRAPGDPQLAAAVDRAREAYVAHQAAHRLRLAVGDVRLTARSRARLAAVLDELAAGAA